MKKQNSLFKIGMNALRDNFFKVDPVNVMKSLKNLSLLFCIFSVLFLAAFIFKIVNIKDESTQNLRLIFDNINILPLYKVSLADFLCIAAYEIVKICIIVLAFWYFFNFLKRIDINEPFKNIKSREYISKVTVLAYLFFFMDFVSTLHLSHFINLLNIKPHFGSFHFEYLFLAYFLQVFAVIFKRGVDLNNEIDLVI